MTQALELRPGVMHWPGYLDRPAQEALVTALREVVREAPFYTPCMPRTGKPFSVRMTNCGSLGWVSDKAGYRYQRTHPETGRPWPPMPAVLVETWQALSGYPHPPEACVVNFYGPGTRMGLHQDRDEEDFDAPVLSLSLGDTATPLPKIMLRSPSPSDAAAKSSWPSITASLYSLSA